MIEKEIEEYYKTNIKQLEQDFSQLQKFISGRIPHSTILLLRILSEIKKIETYLEIGVHNGGSMGLILMGKNIKTCYGIDLFEDVYDKNKHLDKDKFEKYQYFRKDNLSKTKTLKNLNNINKDVKIELIKGNSYFDKTEDKIKQKLGNQKIDLLFIDGDHTRQGVENDYRRFSKFVKKDGYIIFDDYQHPDIKKFIDSMFKDKEVVIFKVQKSNAIQALIIN